VGSRFRALAPVALVALSLVALACEHASGPSGDPRASSGAPGASAPATRSGTRPGTSGAPASGLPGTGRAPVPTGALGTTGSGPVPVPAGRVLEVYRIDDAVDPIRAVKDTEVPDGIEIRVESVPAGDPNRPVKVAFAFARVLAGEKPEAAAAHLRSWAASVPHPFGTQFLVEPIVDEPDAGPASILGYRTLLAREPVVFDDRDVTEARAEPSGDRPSVRVSVGPQTAARFELATKEWTARRIAIVVEGLVAAAPLDMSAITSGRTAIPVSGPTEDARKAGAERLARALTPH
jgi:hypothetical protein